MTGETKDDQELVEAKLAVEARENNLKEALARSYRIIDPLTDGTPVVYVGCYVLRWGKDDEPTVGFNRWTEDEIEAVLAGTR